MMANMHMHPIAKQEAAAEGNWKRAHAVSH